MGRVRTFINGKEIGHMFLDGKEVRVAYIDGKKVYEIPKEEANLLFYAPLHSDIIPLITLDNDISTFTNTGITFGNSHNMAFISTRTANTQWNTKIPICNTYTLAFYSIFLSRTAGNNHIAQIYQTTTERGLYIRPRLSNEPMRIDITAATTIPYDNSSGVNPVINALEHWICSIEYFPNTNSYKNSYWKNGIFLQSVEFTNNIQWPNFSNITPMIGYKYGSNSANAYISDFCVFKGIFDNDKAQKLYNDNGNPLI